MFLELYRLFVCLCIGIECLWHQQCLLSDGFWGILALQMIWKQRYLMKHRLPVGEEEPWPGEPLEEYRQHTRHVFTKKVKEYALRQFLDLDGKVLRFFCVWDDRQVPYGERRPYVCFHNPCCPWALPPMQRLAWDCFLSGLYTNLDFIFITRVYNSWNEAI
jgi:hypothetical protein